MARTSAAQASSVTQDARVELELTFLTPEQGGRAQPASANSYRPHLRVPPDDTLLGVAFVGADTVFPVGRPLTAVATLVYAPAVSYAALQPGAPVEICEGARVVGHGRVVRPLT
jgi:translation elongation factor EF-Tu-like GTPase